MSPLPNQCTGILKKSLFTQLPNRQSPLIMGVLNVTPDSFSDGARFIDPDKAIAHAEQMVTDGADIIDIGGESTRPGAAEVSLDEEIQRVVPLVKRIKSLGAGISVDTSKPEVMLAAAEAGADMLNDVRALSLPGALQAAVDCQLPVCLMHMQGSPSTMQADPRYQDVVSQVKQYLQERAQACQQAGICKQRILLDPGFGFGKKLEHNLQLLTRMHEFADLGYPVLAGLSRKSMLGEITGKPVEHRLAGSLAVALIAMQQGASIVRVHDVAETNDLRQVFLATTDSEI